jgi:hypothetical protein
MLLGGKIPTYFENQCFLQVEDSATDRSLVQGSPAECVCVIECDEAQ